MNKNIITIIILFGVFAAILLLFDLPSYNKFVSFREEIDKQNNSLIEKKELVANVNQLKQVYDSRKDEVKRVYYAIPAKRDIPGLIVQFEALASENGLILENINLGKIKTERSKLGEIESPEETYKSLDITLKLAGNYLAFKSFLQALEFNVRLMDINLISFSSIETEESGLVFTFDVKLKAYYQ